MAVERILTTIIPIIENERKERLEKEKELEQAIADEAKKREDGDKALEERIALEEENRKNEKVLYILSNCDNIVVAIDIAILLKK